MITCQHCGLDWLHDILQHAPVRPKILQVCKQQQHPFNGPLSGTNQVRYYQKGKTNLDLLDQETVSGSGISLAIYKSTPRSDR